MNVIDLHETLWCQLQSRRGKLPHALLLSGIRGLGKGELAREFAASLLCESTHSDGRACGACSACNWLGQGNHPDFRLLQPGALAESEPGDEGEAKDAPKKASQQITIDQVRALDEFLHVGTHRHGLRIIIVRPAEAMNRSTANALLKTLEEPAPGTLFLLVSDEPERLLPTIRSRCQRVSVPLPSDENARRWLSGAGVREAERWLGLAGGAPILAAELAASGERQLIEALIQQLARGGGIDPLAAAAALDKVVKSEKGAQPMKRLMEWAQKWLVDVSLRSTGLSSRYFVAEGSQLDAVVRAANPLRLLAFSRKSLQYKRQAEHPLNSRLFLEDFFMGYAAIFDRR